MKIGDKELVFVELPFGKVRKVLGFEGELRDVTEVGIVMDKWRDLILDCLTPHNDITKEWLEKNLTFTNARELLKGISEASNLVPKQGE